MASSNTNLFGKHCSTVAYIEELKVFVSIGARRDPEVVEMVE